MLEGSCGWVRYAKVEHGRMSWRNRGVRQQEEHDLVDLEAEARSGMRHDMAQHESGIIFVHERRNAEARTRTVGCGVCATCKALS